MLTREQHKINSLEMRYHLAQQLREIRESKQLSLEQVVANSGVPTQILQKLELGHIHTIADIMQLARFYERKIVISFV